MIFEMHKVFSRLAATSDGIDYIAYLKNLKENTYKAWLKSEAAYNDIFKGQMMVLEDMISDFETADDKLRKIDQKETVTNPY